MCKAIGIARNVRMSASNISQIINIGELNGIKLTAPFDEGSISRTKSVSAAEIVLMKK